MHPHLGCYPGQHGRRVVERGSFGRGTAAQYPGALGHRVRHKVLDVVALLGSERPGIGCVQHRIAEVVARHLSGEQALELVVYRVVDDETLGREARLAVTQAARYGGDLGRFGQVR
jgi:hypothetical protein